MISGVGSYGSSAPYTQGLQSPVEVARTKDQEAAAGAKDREKAAQEASSSVRAAATGGRGQLVDFSV